MSAFQKLQDRILIHVPDRAWYASFVQTLRHARGPQTQLQPQALDKGIFWAGMGGNIWIGRLGPCGAGPSAAGPAGRGPVRSKRAWAGGSAGGAGR